MKTKNRFIHYVIAIACIMVTSMLASSLGINTTAVKWIVILLTLLLGVGGINTFFYYLVLSIVEFIAFLILSLIAHSFKTLYLPLVPLVFAIVFFTIQVINANKSSNNKP